MGFKIDLDICGNIIELEFEIESGVDGLFVDSVSACNLRGSDSVDISEIIDLAGMEKTVIDAYLESVGE